MQPTALSTRPSKLRASGRSDQSRCRRRLRRLEGHENHKPCPIYAPKRKRPRARMAVESLIGLIGMTGFEPATSRTPSERATRLRHIPSEQTAPLSIFGKVDLSNRGLKMASNAAYASLLLRVQPCFARVEQVEQVAHLFA